MESNINIYIAGVYISETSHKSRRNILGALSSTFMAIGYLLVYILGYLISWRTTAIIMTFLPAMTAALLLLLPESPYWLIENDRKKDARFVIYNWFPSWPSSPHIFLTQQYIPDGVTLICLNDINLAQCLRVYNSGMSWSSKMALVTY
jgi:MFS family permease